MRNGQPKASGRRIVQALAIAATALGFAGIANAGQWRYEAPLPSGRYITAAIAGPNGTIFVIGGLDDSTEVDVYRPTKKQWVRGPDLPASRAGHAAATGGDGRIYVIGGLSAGSYTSSVLALKPGPGASWTSVAPLPTPRQALGAAAGADGRIYVVGGLVESGDYVNVIEIYDPATDKWTTGAPMPSRRFDMAVVRGGDGRIYAISGRGDGGGGGPVNTVEAYSPATNSWTTVAPLPSKRDALSATTSLEGLIYAIGGCEWKADGTCPVSRQVDVYSPQQNKWRTVLPTQVGHYFGAAATGRHRVFVIGGFRPSTGGPIASVESRPSFCSVCQ
jgi:N-acetylneuraminic acid mutarotase